MKMQLVAIILLCTIPTVIASGQSVAELKFHEGSNLYINGNNDGALASVNQGLKAEPSHTKLNVLKKVIEEQKKREQKQKEEEQKKEQQQQKQDQQKQDQKKQQENKEKQQDKEKEKQEQQKQQDEQKGEQKKDEEQKDEQKRDEEKRDEQELPEDVKKRLKEMKIPEEKAKMLLEAMRNQEIQYLQQDRRKPTRKNPPKGSKPDW